MATVVQCDDGSYLQVECVYRWFISEDVANHTMPFTVMASVAGPQHPFKVAHRETKKDAETVLKAILELACNVIPGGRPGTGYPDYRQMTARRRD